MNKQIFTSIILLLFLVPAVIGQGAISVSFVNQDPDPVAAADTVEVRFKVENLWEDTREEVWIEIIPDYPFSLYSGSNMKNLGRLEGRQDQADAIVADFTLFVDKDAVDGEHPIDVKVHSGETTWTYEDFYIDIEKERIRLKSYIRNSDLVTAGADGKVSIEFANAGGYDIEFLEVDLLPSMDYKLLSASDYIYIGDLDSDDTESEEFSLYVNDGVEMVHIPLNISYEVNDQEYVVQETLELRLLSVEEAKKIGIITESRSAYIWAVVIVLVAVIIAVRKLRKRR